MSKTTKIEDHQSIEFFLELLFDLLESIYLLCK